MRPPATLPDRLGTTLLHAALDEPDAALRAWRSARARLDLRPVAPPSEHHRLLPLIHRNLGPKLDDDERALLGARAERTRVRNEGHVALAARWIALLDLGGVRASVLKGIPLSLRDYGDLGVRPMSDVDLLVPLEQTARALDLLEGAGWYDGGGCSRETLAQLHHGAGLVNADGGSLDVHWQLSGFLEPTFEPRTEPIVVGGRPTATLDPTDTLLHVILHGAWHGSGASVRWVADAVTVLRRATEDRAIDGRRIADVADAAGVGAIVGAALAHLEQEHQAPVPAGLATELAAQRVPRRVRHRQRVVSAPVDGPERIGGLAHLRAYWTYTRWHWDDRAAARTLPLFLTELWGLESSRALPAALVLRPLRRARGGRRERGKLGE